MIRPDQLQRLEELLSQPDMVPCMPLLRADVAALLGSYKSLCIAVSYKPEQLISADQPTHGTNPISFCD
jgi:hypothetical protein